jgi:hypothetical protein
MEEMIKALNEIGWKIRIDGNRYEISNGSLTYSLENTISTYDENGENKVVTTLTPDDIINFIQSI